jgi:membrane protease YdiL (CAAX protease family)
VFGPFVEELFFRGVLYSWIRERMPAATAIALSSLIFAGLHPGFAIQFIGGLLFASLFEWRRNVWPGFIVHAAANVGIWIVPWMNIF